jgi:hypothetical protein
MTVHSWIVIIGVSMPHLVVTGLTGAALALLPTVPAAQAATADEPRASLRLTLSHPDGSASREPSRRSVTLRCDPTGGSHPRAAQACADLGKTMGTFERAPKPGTACTMIYAPVIAEAEGHWHGRRVSFHAQYVNGCDLAARTGSIFQF